MNFLYAIGATISGISFAVQGPVNTALGKRTNKFQSTMISFLGGTLILLAIVLIWGNGNLSAINTVPVWQLLGGIYGAIGVCVLTAAMPYLGVALTLTVVLLGQIVSGAIIDTFGLFGVEKAEVTVLRILGIIAVAAGIFCIYLQKSQIKDEDKDSSKRIALIVIAFISGLLGAIQSPTNAALSNTIGNIEATFVSFLVGLSVIAIVTLIVGKGRLTPMRGVGIKPWMVIGGAYGVFAIFLNVLTVVRLGAALQVACGLAGQLLGGIVIDALGVIETDKVRIDKFRIIGVVIIVIGDILIYLSK